jgi:hypothetical protein
MTTRIVLATLVTLGWTVPAFAAAPAGPGKPNGINAREHRQVERIQDGKHDGQLTNRELDKLRADEAAIRAEERVYRDSGRGLDKQEYKDLQNRLDRVSGEIYKFKHNGRT